MWEPLGIGKKGCRAGHGTISLVESLALVYALGICCLNSEYHFRTAVIFPTFNIPTSVISFEPRGENDMTVEVHPPSLARSFGYNVQWPSSAFSL